MRLALAAVAAMALAACGGPDSVAEEAENTQALPTIDEGTASPAGAAPENAAVTNDTRAFPGTIPDALWGRWGLTPRDCMSPLEEARGLLVISANELRFYESRALPTADVQTSDNSISGEFAFTGEGQKWTSHQTLELQDNNLVRTQRDPLGSFRYVRC